MTRYLTALLLICAIASPALSEQRPRPLGWALDAMRGGDFDVAERIAERDGTVARDVIIWHRLRAAQGDFAQITDFINRRPDWPGMDYLYRRSEPEVIKQGDDEIIAFFEQMPAGPCPRSECQRANRTSAGQSGSGMAHDADEREFAGGFSGGPCGVAQTPPRRATGRDDLAAQL